MTIISSDILKNTYTGNNSTTVFAYEFRLLTEGELLVTLDGVVQTIALDYTVSGVGNLNGGDVTFTTAPNTGVSVVLLQNPDFTQEIDYNELDAFPAESHEEGLDRATIRDLTLKEQVDRSLKYRADTSTTKFTIGEPTDGYILTFDGEDGNIIGRIPSSIEISGLDTMLSTLTDGDFLVYNSSSAVWENKTTAETQTELGLGTAAYEDVGTSAGNVVQLDGNAKLPALTAGAAIAMDTNKITGMGDPTNAQDAVTLNYILGLFGNGLLSTNGYAVIPIKISDTIDQLYIQWGISTGAATRTVNFPTAFPNACYNVQSTIYKIDSPSIFFQTSQAANYTTSGFDLQVGDVSNNPQPDPISWLAIGY